MRRSERQVNQELSELQRHAANDARPIFLDEFCNITPVANTSGYTALALYITPLFVPMPMNVGGIFLALDAVSGIVNVRAALYKALNPNIKARSHKRSTSAGSEELFSGDVVQWSRVVVGPPVQTDGPKRYTFELSQDVQIRPPDIYGLALMADSSDVIYRGVVATGNASLFPVFRSSEVRANLADFPATLTMVQGVFLADTPCVILRSRRALGWYGA